MEGKGKNQKETTSDKTKAKEAAELTEIRRHSHRETETRWRRNKQRNKDRTKSQRKKAMGKKESGAVNRQSRGLFGWERKKFAKTFRNLNH